MAAYVGFISVILIRNPEAIHQFEKRELLNDQNPKNYLYNWDTLWLYNYMLGTVEI